MSDANIAPDFFGAEWLYFEKTRIRKIKQYKFNNWFIKWKLRKKNYCYIIYKKDFNKGGKIVD